MDEPQSNQRGIETVLDPARYPFPVGGLNRTSVGLKRGSDDHPPDRRGGLNRTSVGLKLSPHPPPEGGGGQASIEPAWD